MNSNNKPFYNRLYADMIRDKYPDKADSCAKFIKKKRWIALDVIEINEILFGSSKGKLDIQIDQKHRAYDTESILQILRDQKANKMNNNETTNKYGLSRNTLSKWRKIFENDI